MVALAQSVVIGHTTYAAGTDHTAMPAVVVDEIRNPGAWVGGVAPALSAPASPGNSRITIGDLLTTAARARAALGLPALIDAVALPASNGTDDTVAINTVLATNPGKTVKGQPGSTYLTTAPLVVRSGTTLDMTGCTVRLKTGSGGNMLQNYVVGQTRRVVDAATTSSSATLTSATAAFTSADVGKAIRVERAGTAGARLVTTISAVTNATTVTLATTAGATVTGQYAAIGNRDTNITIRGGVWDRLDNNSLPVANTWDAHSLRFRHVDGLTIRDLEHTATGGKYAINPGDCTAIKVHGIRFRDTSSDGVHLNGPCDQVIIKDIQAGRMGDDVVSLTAQDTFSIITDCAGDITDVAIEDISYREAIVGLYASAVKIVAGQNTTQNDNTVVANVRVRNITGPTTTQSVVYLGDTVPVGGNGGTFRNISIENVTSLGGYTRAPVLLHTGTMQDIRVTNVRPHAGDLYGVAVDATIDRLTVRDLHWRPTTTAFVSGINFSGTAAIDHLIVEGWRVDCTGNSPVMFRLGTTGARISEFQMSDCRFSSTSGGGIISQSVTGITMDLVQIDKLITSGFAYPLGVYRGTTKLSASNIKATGMTGWLYAAGSEAAVTVVGASGLDGDVPFTVTADSPGYVRMAVGNTLFAGDRNALTAGETTIAREVSTSDAQITTGTLALTYFTARKTETIANVATITRGTAAATPTLCRIGIYEVDASDGLTLVASTTNDTTMWASTFARYSRGLQASFTKTAGKRYAVGVVYVGTTGPRLSGCNPLIGAETAIAPRINGSLASQTDLPPTIAAGSVTNSLGASLYTSLLP